MDAATADSLIRYIEELHRWNQTYNLSGVKDLDDMVVRHLLDSLAVAPWIEGPRVVDLGSGAGLPGIPLAAVMPQHRFILLDSSGKRARFLHQVQALLEIRNVEVVQRRASEYRPDPLANTIVARAFGSLAKIVESAHHLLDPGGRIVAQKGRYPSDELAELPEPWRSRARLERVQVPGLEAQRHVAVLTGPGGEADRRRCATVISVTSWVRYWPLPTRKVAWGRPPRVSTWRPHSPRLAATSCSSISIPRARHRR